MANELVSDAKLALFPERVRGAEINDSRAPATEECLSAATYVYASLMNDPLPR